jgi:hypothetical protein
MLFAALLILQAHFAASYLVPLDREAKATFGGLLRWAWPWSIGDGGLLGRTSASGEYPVSGIFLAGAAALMFVLAALAVMGWWVPPGWWRFLAVGELSCRYFSWWASSEPRRCCRWFSTSSLRGLP